MEQIEFVIHPDGRVEEKVTGIKGKNVCCPRSPARAAASRRAAIDSKSNLAWGLRLRNRADSTDFGQH
jgi:hypothetical protein